MISTIREELEGLEASGLLRKLPQAYEVAGPRVKIDSQEFISLSSNNYLGLATHPLVKHRSIEAIERMGCSATGSRLLSGNSSLHEELEEKLARFKGVESALLFNSGYVANLSLLTALATEGDRIVSDKLNHASLVDGARFSGAESRYFKHGDLERAEELLATPGARRKFLVIDGVFSMDGDICDLPRVIEVCARQQAGLIIDEAHSTGVLGKTGKGTFEHFGIQPNCKALGLPLLIQMGTFGKALGGFGAFVACDSFSRALLMNRARPFIFSTALPPAVLGAVLGAIEALETEPELLTTLRKNTARFREKLSGLEFAIDVSLPTPIVPLVLGDSERAVRFSSMLNERGILAPAVRPPSVAINSSRIRCTLTAQHTDSDLDAAIAAIRDVMIRVGPR